MRPMQKPNRNRGKTGNNMSNRGPGGGGKGFGNVVNRVFDSAGPEGKVRGTPQQIIDKYEQLARDAQTSGDRVMSENFLQHAEHYLRMLTSAQAEMQAAQAQHQQSQPQHQQPAGGQPQPNVQPQPDVQPRREAETAREGGGLTTIDPGAGEQPSALVDTPESPRPDVEAGAQPEKPARAPRRRRSPRRERSAEDGGDPSGAADGAGGAQSEPRNEAASS